MYCGIFFAAYTSNFTTFLEKKLALEFKNISRPYLKSFKIISQLNLDYYEFYLIKYGTQLYWKFHAIKTMVWCN